MASEEAMDLSIGAVTEEEEDVEEEIKELKEEIKELKEEIKELKEKIKRVEEDIKKLKEEIKRVKEDIKAKELKIDEIRSQIECEQNDDMGDGQAAEVEMLKGRVKLWVDSKKTMMDLEKMMMDDKKMMMDRKKMLMDCLTKKEDRLTKKEDHLMLMNKKEVAKALKSQKRKRQNVETVPGRIKKFAASHTPSSFAKVGEWSNCEDFTRLFLNHRCDHGSNVNLFFDFDAFNQDFSLDHTDSMFYMNFASRMANSYRNEDMRASEICDCLSQHLQCEVLQVEKCDAAVIVMNNPCLLIEMKNEVGTGGCDSYIQLQCYYSRLIKKFNCNVPCLLVEIIGPIMNIYGCVMADTNISVDWLAGMWLTLQPKSQFVMKRNTQILKALKLTLSKICKYQNKLYDVPEEDRDVYYPRFHSFDDGTKFTYTGVMKPHLYLAELEDGSPVVVKFVEQYCKEAHQALAPNFAPKLLHCRQVTTFITMVVMEYFPDSKCLAEFLPFTTDTGRRKVQILCKEALATLHQAGFVHGDFRDTNVLVIGRTEKDFQVKVIDFDWSGRDGDVKYPLFMNRIQIAWPSGAEANAPIKKEHDEHWLRTFFS